MIAIVDARSYSMEYDLELATALRCLDDVGLYCRASDLTELMEPSTTGFHIRAHQQRLGGSASALFEEWATLSHVISDRPRVLSLQWQLPGPIDSIQVKRARAKKIHVSVTLHNVGRVAHVASRPNLEAARQADSVIVHSQRAKASLSSVRGFRSKPIGVFPHGPLRQWHTDSELSRRAPYEIPLPLLEALEGRRVISLLGSDESYKGWDIVVDALRIARMPEDCLVIAAGRVGAERTQALAAAGALVHNGFLTQFQYEYLLRSSYLTILPYREISQSGALLKAMARGVPALCSDLEAFTDALGPQLSNMLTFRTGDSRSLVTRLDDLLHAGDLTDAHEALVTRSKAFAWPAVAVPVCQALWGL